VQLTVTRAHNSEVEGGDKGSWRGCSGCFGIVVVETRESHGGEAVVHGVEDCGTKTVMVRLSTADLRWCLGGEELLL